MASKRAKIDFLLSQTKKTVQQAHACEEKYDGLLSAVLDTSIKSTSPQPEIVDRKLQEVDDAPSGLQPSQKVKRHRGPMPNASSGPQPSQKVKRQRSPMPKKTTKQTQSKVAVTKQRRFRRKPCHPAIVTKQDKEGYLQVSIDPTTDFTPTHYIKIMIRKTINDNYHVRKVKHLRTTNNRTDWVKAMGFIIGNTVNAYLRRYTESALPYRTPYYFVEDIELLPDQEMEEQLAALPEPVASWFSMTLADQQINNEMIQMNPNEAAQTVAKAVYNVRKGVYLGASRYGNKVQQDEDDDEEEQ